MSVYVMLIQESFIYIR